MLRMLVVLGNLPFQIRTKLAAVARELREDTSGAEMVEYAVTIGLITAAAIVAIVVVGQWVAGSWNFLCTTLKANATYAAGGC
jgi:pilus assembly protein Flp/PilA